jgi:hypothetical protein
MKGTATVAVTRNRRLTCRHRLDTPWILTSQDDNTRNAQHGIAPMLRRTFSRESTPGSRGSTGLSITNSNPWVDEA